MDWVRRMIYSLGFRPKYPSLLFSPSLHIMTQLSDKTKDLFGMEEPYNIEEFYQFVGKIPCNGNDGTWGDSTCNYNEPHKHGFACDVTCWVCSDLTKTERGGL